MAGTGPKYGKYFLILLLLVCVHQSECKRNKNSGGRRTNSGGRTTPRSRTTERHEYHTTPRHHQDLGFENVQHRVPQQNSPPIGFNTNQGGGHQPQPGDTFHKTNVNQVGNSPLSPSAPLAPPPNSPGLGFENVQQRIPGQNNQPNANPVGFNVPNSPGGGYHPQSGAPSAPVGNPNNPSYHPQNNQPGYNVQQNAGGGYHPQPGYDNRFPQQPGHPYGSNVPPNAGTGYHPQYPGAPNSYAPHTNYPGNYYQTPGGGVYNPQPYYNPHFASSGVQPQIYQPVQQSGGSSLLGYAGTFAGGYLIGRLTSGGGHSDSGSGDRQYTVHHYHHNLDGVPKQISVSNSSLTTCSQNDTQGLCVPNTFPICLSNGTIMCVTHTPYTVPCGANSTMACVISALPCPDGNSTCNATESSTNTAVYIPCISNVTVAKMKVVDNATAGTPSNVTSDSVLNNSNVQLCVTAIAEPKKPPESPVGSYMNLLAQMALLPYNMSQENGTTSTPLNISSSLAPYYPVNVPLTVLPNSTDSSFVNVSVSTEKSLLNISSSTETSTFGILNSADNPPTVQPLPN